ncbi:MAG: hypothetical protein AAGA95_18195, partial [Pseudomonadota bacterium]
ATWLYGIRLDCGVDLQLRTGHEERREVGQAVSISIETGVPLAAFAANSSHGALIGPVSRQTHPRLM